MVNWGIIGCGNIATKFANDFSYVNGSKILAVASRSRLKACFFSKKHGIERFYGNYEDLAKDPDIDAIYIATINTCHMNNAVLCLKNRKSVLCEKPFAMSYDQAKTMTDVAREENVFLMEAMRPRFLPVYKTLQESLKGIGDINLLMASFFFNGGDDKKGRLLNRYLGGGALLDIGIYLVSLSSMILKSQPKNIISYGKLIETGVDVSSSYFFEYEDGAMAYLDSSIEKEDDYWSEEAFICGDKGNILIHSPFWRASTISVYSDGEECDKIDIPFNGEGLNFMIEEVNRCIKEGEKESCIMPLDESLEIMKTVDIIKDQLGLDYEL